MYPNNIYKNFNTPAQVKEVLTEGAVRIEEKETCPACRGSKRSGIKLGNYTMPCPWCTLQGRVSHWEAERIRRILNIKDDAEQMSLALES